MKLTLQKRLAASVMGVSPKRVVFDPSALTDVKEAITKQDIRGLISKGIIVILPERGVSRVRANKIRLQKRKGLKRGKGSRKGSKNARSPPKRAWINKVRSQRKFLKRLLEKSIVTHDVYKDLYRKTGGGFFRSVKHIQIFMAERNLTAKKPEARKEAAPAAAQAGRNSKDGKAKPAAARKPRVHKGKKQS